MASQSVPDSCKDSTFPCLITRMTQTSQLHECLRSNDHPSQTLSSHSQAMVLASPSKLDLYDAEILRLRAALERAEHDRAVVSTYSHLCRSIRSPIRRLPSEMLLEIFEWFLKDAEGAQRFPFFDMDLAKRSEEEGTTSVANINAGLLRLSQVCLRWHRLVTEKSTLWSFIDLRLNFWSGPRQDRLMAHLKSFLIRGPGRDTPLEVSIHSSGHHSTLRRSMKLLAQHSRRWKIASFAMELGPVDISAVNRNLSLLELLQIDAWEWSPSQLATVFEVAPRLTTVRYCGPPDNLSNLPLEQLQVLDYLDVVQEELDEFLPLMARISDLTPKCRSVYVFRGHQPYSSPTCLW
ncbi:hypothetical protein C8R43DRAFT_369103 [Mycena crocata]|nr:hypothetical protein C8R43DRAFT_369103 [Mycena crocata]